MKTPKETLLNSVDKLLEDLGIKIESVDPSSSNNFVIFKDVNQNSWWITIDILPQNPIIEDSEEIVIFNNSETDFPEFPL